MSELQKGGQLTTTNNQSQVAFNFFDPQQFETMQRVCKMFASSELVPDMYKTVYKPFPNGATEEQVKAIQYENRLAENKAMSNCMIAIEIAQRIGASPLMIMQNMVPIYGKPSWSSKFLVATVNTCGRFNPLQYKFTDKGMLGMVDYVDYVWDNQARKKVPTTKQFDGKKIMDIECVAYTTAKGSDNILESSPVSVRLSIQEGWYTKSGSKWQTMTKQMLMYRAASFWTNAYAPELSMGMKTEDEIRDIVDVEFEDVTAELEKEKAANANKTNIGFDNEQKPTPTPTSEQPKPQEAEKVDEQPKGQTESPKPTPGF